MTEKIGMNAGLIWHVLDEIDEPLNLKHIKSKTKIRTERDVLLALGWLAKEGKLIFDGEGKDFTVQLSR